jgi:hypothetical protein
MMDQYCLKDGNYLIKNYNQQDEPGQAKEGWAEDEL